MDLRSAPTSPEQAAATWAQVSSSWPKYRITVTDTGFGGAIRATTTVDDGRSTTETLPPMDDPARSPAPLPAGFPRTVDDLLRLAAGPTAAHVVYDPTGVPLLIDVDPIPNGVDDEHTISVGVSVPSQRLLLPTVTSPPSPDTSSSPSSGSRAASNQDAVVSAGGLSVDLRTWGSSTCWPIPVEASAASADVVLVETIDFPHGPCTLNLGPHRGSVAVSPATTEPATAVVVHSFGGTAAAPGVGLYAVRLPAS